MTPSILQRKTGKTVPCGICGRDTPMLGTKRCDRCWELENRIHMDPDLARKILKNLSGEVK